MPISIYVAFTRDAKSQTRILGVLLHCARTLRDILYVIAHSI